MTGFDYSIDREIGLIKISYRSENEHIFKDKTTNECLDILIEVLQNIQPLIDVAKRIETGSLD